MQTFKKGSTGKPVEIIQALLKQHGYSIDIDSVFGPQTEAAVRQFQQDENLAVDGIVGPTTSSVLSRILQYEKVVINNALFKRAAQTLNVEVAAIRAVHQVESAGRTGFLLPDGRPEILFEGHIFWQQLKKQGINPEPLQPLHPDILFPKWDKSSYQGKEAEYTRLHRACVIDHRAALCSTAWGMFQIMGFNYKLCGYNSIWDFSAAMYLSMDNHIKAFVSFLQYTGLDVPLREKSWAAFAKRYNGPLYKENRYDERLEEAYEKIRG